jgi:LPXTG-motif cell wall-anchored protein
MRKTIFLVAATLFTAVAFAAPASAQYGDTPAPGVSNPSPTVGSDVTVSGNGCSGTVTVSLDGVVVATTEAGADGTYSVSFTVPDEPGNYVLSIGCAGVGDAAGTLGVAVGGELAGGELAGGSIPACGELAGEGTANTSCVLTVLAEGAVTPAGTLPRTGDDSLPLAGIGVVLVALGGLAVLVTRKRSTATA